MGGRRAAVVQVADYLGEALAGGAFGADALHDVGLQGCGSSGWG
jgi:hypothetical protein